ncbi:MAG: serine/threonine-protein kinase [Myxococcota bacterium]
MGNPLGPSSGVRFDPPGAAARAEGAELSRMVEIARSSPLFEALLSWIDGLVIVLNRERQIVLASDEVAETFRFDDPSRLIGLRMGEAMGCVHVDPSTGGCGTSTSCRYCGALKAILDAKRFDAPVESECRLTLRVDGVPETMKLRTRTSRAKRRSEEFTVVVLQREDRLERAAAVTRFDFEEDWPIGIEAYYRIRKLGTGGMGSVFLARDHRGREYAIKTARAAFAADDSLMSRFLSEITLTIVLEHPNIVRTFRANQTDAGAVYMVTEYCCGGSVGQWLQRRGPIGWELALCWMNGCARALAYAWGEHRLVHRDIKPDNILLDAHHRAKLADFGVARRVSPTDPKVTAAGVLVGSIHYMAPEQALAASDVDVRADLYGLGSTFFELLSGRTPFDGPTPANILSRKMTKRAPQLSGLRSDLPRELTETIDWLLATKPENRPWGPEVVVDRLQALADRAGIDADAPRVQDT